MSFEFWGLIFELEPVSPEFDPALGLSWDKSANLLGNAKNFCFILFSRHFRPFLP